MLEICSRLSISNRNGFAYYFIIEMFTRLKVSCIIKNGFKTTKYWHQPNVIEQVTITERSDEENYKIKH